MTTLSFGKYSNVSLDKIPPPYLRWVIKNVTGLDYRYSGLKQQIQTVLRNDAIPTSLPVAPAARVSQRSPRPSNSVVLKIAGVSYHQPVVVASTVGDKVRLVPDPVNQFDLFAIKLINSRLESSGGGWLGFIPRKYSTMFTRAIGSGHRFDASIASIGGSPIVGATIRVVPQDVG